MKKTLLFTLALSGALVSSAAMPDVRANRQVVPVGATPVAYDMSNVMVKKAEIKANPASLVKKATTNFAELSKSFGATSLGDVHTYATPDGLYWQSIASDGYAWSVGVGVVPPFKTVTFENISDSETESWNFSIGDLSTSGGESFVAEDQNLEVEYDHNFSTFPKLTTKDGVSYQNWTYIKDSQTAEANYIFSTGFSESTPNKISYPLSNQPFGGFWGLKATENDYLYSSILTTFGCSGFGAYYSKPLAPYYLESLTAWISGLNFVNEAGELTIHVYAVNDDGSVGEELALAVATKDDVLGTYPVGSPVDFKFYKEDELGGREQVVLYPNTALLLIFSDFTEDVTFTGFMANFPWMDDEVNTYVPNSLHGVIEITKDGSKSYLPTQYMYTAEDATELSDNDGGPMILLNASMGSLKLDQTQVVIPVEGGAADVSVADSNIKLNSDYFSLNQDVPEWITISAAGDGQTTLTFTITAEALPEGETGRTAYVDFTTVLGGSAVVKVIQGDGGSVGAIKADAVKVSVVNGNFVVNGVEGKVAVYNAAGQLVANTTLGANGVIPAANLAKGMYILKFDNNKVARVLK